MKQLFYVLIVGMATVACTQNNKTTTTEETVNTQITVDSSNLIVPGARIGNLYLDQDMQAVFKILGKADSGDAAMGKAWGIWNVKTSTAQTPDKIAVYSSYKDSTMSSKSVKELLVTATKYRSNTGVHTRMPLDSLKTLIPELEKTATYVFEGRPDTLEIYDAVKQGIAFEVKTQTRKKIATAIYVHFQNQSVNNTYLTIYPGWKKL